MDNNIFHYSIFIDRILVLVATELNQLRTEFRIGRDPRLFLYSAAIKSKSGNHSDASKFHRENYNNCVFCGKADGENGIKLTMAHLISEIDPISSDVNLDVFGPPNYHDAINVKSPRNFLRLCGTKGQRGTCHDMFDHFRLGLNYNPLRQTYFIYSVDSTHFLHEKEIRLSEMTPPYRRLLAWRFRKMILEFGHLFNGMPLLDVVDHSDVSSEAGHAGSSDEYDAAGSEKAASYT